MAAGVLRRQSALDARLAPLVTRDWAKVPPRLQDLLRLGAYQLVALDRVPAHAAVDTSVTLAREEGGPRAGGFVNAVLRRLGAQPDGAEPAARTRRRSDADALAAAPLASALAGGALARAVRARGDPRGSSSGTTAGRASCSSRRGRALAELERRWRAAGIATEPAPYGAGLDDRPPAPARSCPDSPKAPSWCRTRRRRCSPGTPTCRRARRCTTRPRHPAGKTIALGPRGAAGGRRRREPAPGAAGWRSNLRARRQRARAPGRGRRAPAAGPAGRRRAARRALSRHRHLRAASGRARRG